MTRHRLARVALFAAKAVAIVVAVWLVFIVIAMAALLLGHVNPGG